MKTSEVINFVCEATVSGAKQVQKDLRALGKFFEVDLGGTMQKVVQKSHAVMAKGFKAALKGPKSVFSSLKTLRDFKFKPSKESLKSMEELKKSFSAKGIGKGIENSAQVLTAAVENAKGAFEGLTKGFLSGLGGVSKKLGAGLGERGKQLRESKKKGEKGYATAQIAGFSMQAMGAAVGILGSVATALSMVVKLLFDAEAQAKELNNAIVESGIGGGDLVTNFGRVGDTFKSLSDMAVDWNNNMKWGTVAKDQIAMIGAFNEAGFTIKEMTKDINDGTQAMKDYQDVTRVALTYAKLLGQTSDSMASQQGEYMESLGGSLSYVEQQFSAIFKTAQLSGFGVKRFYSMIQQATSGMALYNVRLDEAAGLLIQLGNILGSKVAGDFLSQLSKGFVDEGMTERYKRVMLTGVEETQSIMYDQAMNTAQAFGSNLATQTAAVQGKVKGLLGGVDIKTEEGQKSVVDKLAKMSERDKAVLIAEVRSLDQGLAQELTKLADVSQAQLGGVLNNAEAIDALGPGGALAMQLQMSMTRFGKPLYELKGVELAAWENMTGISGEQRIILTNISRGLEGQFMVLKGLAPTTEEGTKALQAKLTELGDGKMTVDEYKSGSLAAQKVWKEMQDKYGSFIKVNADGTSEVVKAQFDASGSIIEGSERTMENVQDFIMSNSEQLAAATEEAMDENTAIAMEISRNTMDIAKVMEIGVAYWVQQIYNVIAPWMNKLSNAPDPKDVAATTNAILSRMEGLQTESIEKTEELSQLQAKLRKAKPEDKAGIEAEIEAKKEEIASLSLARSLQQRKLTQVQQATTKDEFAKVGSGDKEGTLKIIGGDEAVQTEKVVDEALQVWYDSMVASGKVVTKGMHANAERLTYKAISDGLDTGRSLDQAVSGATMQANMSYRAERDIPQGEMSGAEAAGNVLTDMAPYLLGPAASLALGALGAGEKKDAQFVTIPEQIRAKQRIAGTEQGAATQVQDLAGVAKHLTGGASGFAKMDAKAKDKVADDMGISAELLEELVRISETDLADTSYEKLSVDQKKKLIDISKTLPSKTVRKQENEVLAKEIARQQAIREARAALQGVFGGEPVPESLLESIVDKGWAQSFALMSKEDQATQEAYLKETHRRSGKADDFVFRPGREPLSFSSQDTLIGLKEGGPLAKAAVGGGGTKSVTINIYGSQDEVYKTVKRVLTEIGAV